MSCQIPADFTTDFLIGVRTFKIKAISQAKYCSINCSFSGAAQLLNSGTNNCYSISDEQYMSIDLLIKIDVYEIEYRQNTKFDEVFISSFKLFLQTERSR